MRAEADGEPGAVRGIDAGGAGGRAKGSGVKIADLNHPFDAQVTLDLSPILTWTPGTASMSLSADLLVRFVARALGKTSVPNLEARDKFADDLRDLLNEYDDLRADEALPPNLRSVTADLLAGAEAAPRECVRPPGTRGRRDGS